MKTFTLTIQSPAKQHFAGEVRKLTLQTELGALEIEAGHASLLGAIDFTHMIVHRDSEQDTFLARSGSLYVDNQTNDVKVLVSFAAKEKEVSDTTVKEYLDFIEAQLRDGNDLSAFHMEFLQEEKLTLEKMIVQGS